MYGFTYTNVEYVEHALSRGAFKISKASSFRRMEKSGSLIPDPLDSAARIDLSELSQIELEVFLARERQRNSSMINNQNEITRDRDFWIFCLCEVGDNQALLAEGRDAIVKVKDLSRFAWGLREAHPDKLGRPEVGRVLYRQRTGDPRLVQMEEDEFYKDVAFTSQRELRVRWEIVRESEDDFFISKAPEHLFATPENTMMYKINGIQVKFNVRRDNSFYSVIGMANSALGQAKRALFVLAYCCSNLHKGDIAEQVFGDHMSNQDTLHNVYKILTAYGCEPHLSCEWPTLEWRMRLLFRFVYDLNNCQPGNGIIIENGIEKEVPTFVTNPLQGERSVLLMTYHQALETTMEQGTLIQDIVWFLFTINSSWRCRARELESEFPALEQAAKNIENGILAGSGSPELKTVRSLLSSNLLGRIKRSASQS